MERVDPVIGRTVNGSSIGRIVDFVRVMYRPHYALYGLLWVLALEGTAALVSGSPGRWHPTWETAVRLLVVLVVLLYLRMVDEQKDLEYDRINNPDRPLVTGAISATELRVSMALIGIVSVAASLTLSVGSAVTIAAALAYGLFLWAAEEFVPLVRRNIMVNLVITYPVQLLVTAYVVVSAIDTGQVEQHWQAYATAIIFAGAFLQFEFARKTTKVVAPEQLLYSNTLGATGSAVTTVLFAAAAVAADLLLVQPWQLGGAAAVIGWIPLVLIVIPLVGLREFLRTSRETFPLGPPVVFIIALYATLIAQAATA